MNQAIIRLLKKLFAPCKRRLKPRRKPLLIDRLIFECEHAAGDGGGWIQRGNTNQRTLMIFYPREAPRLRQQPLG